MAFLHPSCLLCFFVFPYLCLFLFVSETHDSITLVASKATFQYPGKRAPIQPGTWWQEFDSLVCNLYAAQLGGEFTEHSYFQNPRALFERFTPHC